MEKKVKLTGAAKKLATVAKNNAFDVIVDAEASLKSVNAAKEFGVLASKVTELLEAGEAVVLNKVKDDPNTAYSETLTLVKYNTLNKITAVDGDGAEVVLIRTKRGKFIPRNISSYFRISKSNAVYFPAIGQVDAEAANAEVDAQETED